MQLYLITGFLGAGKTTFLKQFVRQFEGRKLHLIINEFGQVGVDAALLAELNASLQEIANGSIFCSCRLDRFEAVLADAVSAGADLILVETSGLSDPTNIRKILSQKNFTDIEYKGCVCLVDAVRFGKVARVATVCQRQVAVSSLAVLNKIDLASPAEATNAQTLALQFHPTIHLRQTSHGFFDPSWLALIQPQTVVEVSTPGADITLQKACVTLRDTASPETTMHLLEMAAQGTYRVKGFVRLNDGQIWLADCVGPMVALHPHEGNVPDGVGVLNLLAGQGTSLRKTIKELKNWYGQYLD